MAKIDLKALKSGLSDDDFDRVGEVWEKQDLYSRASRKAWIAKKWINALANYICACMILFTLFSLFSSWHTYSKPTPLILYEYEDGVINCARPFVIEDGQKFYKFSDQQIETCLSLKKYSK